MSAIQQETDQMLKRALAKMSMKYKAEPVNVMLFIEEFFFNDGSVTTFKVAIDEGKGLKIIKDEDQDVKMFQFYEILGYSSPYNPTVMVKQLIAMPFLSKLLIRISEDLNIERNNLSIRILTNSNTIENLYFIVYDKEKQVKQINYDYIFENVVEEEEKTNE